MKKYIIYIMFIILLSSFTLGYYENFNMDSSVGWTLDSLYYNTYTNDPTFSSGTQYLTGANGGAYKQTLSAYSKNWTINISFKPISASGECGVVVAYDNTYEGVGYGHGYRISTYNNNIGVYLLTAGTSTKIAEAGFRNYNVWNNISIKHLQSNNKWEIWNNSINLTLTTNVADSTYATFNYISSVYSADGGYIDNIKVYDSKSTVEFDLYFNTLNPLNGTNINNSKNLNFTLANVVGTANCTLYDNNISSPVITKYNLVAGQYNFSFNSSYWTYGLNNITVNCTDTTKSVAQSKLLLVDTILPQIKYINYSVGSTSTTLNRSLFSVITKFNVSIKTNDTNNYLLNVTIFNNQTKKKIKSVQAINLNEVYIMNISLDMINNLSGWYGVNVTSKDAHTLTSINYDTQLKDTEYLTKDYIGQEVDEKVKVYSDLTSVKSFNLIQTYDRQKFNLKFNDGIELFNMIVEGKESVVYVGDKYGYQGHFIIDNNYWYDLMNKAGATVQSVNRISDTKYVVTMQKPIGIKEITFDSLGIINKNNQVIYFQYVYSNFSIILRDSNSKVLLSGINFTIDYVGTNYQTKKTTTTGTTQFLARFDSATDEVSLRAYSTLITDYSLVIRDFTLSQGVNTNITLYLANTSSLTTTKLVQIRVVDEILNRLSGAKVRIYKQDTSTNTFLEISDQLTNSNGETSFIFETYTKFYKFVVEYGGETVYVSTSPITITDNDDLLPLNAYVGYGTIPTDGKSDIIFTRNFNYVDNLTGYFDTYISSPVSMTFCYNITYFYDAVRTDVQYVCYTGYGGLFNSANIVVVGLSDARIQTFVNLNDGNGLRLFDSYSHPIGYDFATLADNGRLFVYIGLILLCAFGFYLHPIVGLIILSVGFLAIALTNFTLITLGISTSIIAMIIISIISISKK